jgi:hypothetical protein
MSRPVDQLPDAVITSAPVPPVLGECRCPKCGGRGFQDYNTFACDDCGYGFGTDDNLNIVERTAKDAPWRIIAVHWPTREE